MTLISTSKFFEVLFGNLKQSHPDYEVLFVNMKPKADDPKKQDVVKENSKRISPFNFIARGWTEGENTYFHCGIDFDRKRFPRLRKVDVDGVCFLWVDVDRAVSDSELQSWKTHKFAPTLIVSSGNGYHLYWALTSFQNDCESAEAKNRWLASEFGGDTCGDVARLLRVPGTYNVKFNPAKLVEVVFFNRDAGGFQKQYNFDEFESVAGVYSVAGDGVNLNSVILDDAFLEDPRIVGCEWLKDMIVSRFGVTDRSDRDGRVAKKLAELNFTEDEIFSVLTHPTWATGDKGRDRKSYAQHQTKKATASSGGFLAVMEQMEQAFAGPEKKKRKKKTEVAKKEKTESISPLGNGLMADIMAIHENVMQVGGDYRGNKQAPKLGGLFGKFAAECYPNYGYRFVYDTEFSRPFIANGSGGVFDADGEKFSNFISDTCGYSEGQQEFNFILNGVQRYVIYHGEKLDIGRWVHFDQKRNLFFILADQDKGIVYAIDENGEFETSFNGTEDVLLRPRGNFNMPLELSKDVSLREAIELLERNFTSYIAGSSESQKFLTCFMLASILCYGAPIITLPLLHLTGDSGMGKSHTLGLMTSFLYGTYSLYSYTDAAAYRIAQTDTLMAFDDKEEVNSGIEHFFLTSATDSTRLMANTSDQVNVVHQKAHVINAVTSIKALSNRALRRRSVEVEIDKEKYPSSHLLNHDAVTVLTDNRSKIWSGLTELFGNVIGGYRTKKIQDLARKVYGLIEVNSFKSHSDFMALMVFIESRICNVMERPFDETAVIKEFCKVARIDDEREILGRDPLILCLENFFEKVYNVKAKEEYYSADAGDLVKVVALQHGIRSTEWGLTEPEDNAKIEQKLGYKVRGIRASAGGWISIFKTDTREFAKTVDSPVSLGKQFGRVKEKATYPFYIKKGPSRGSGRSWFVFQRIE